MIRRLSRKIIAVATGLFFMAAASPVLAALPALPSEQNVQKQLEDNPIYKDINTIANFLGALAGVVIIANIIVGGIQYSMAGGSPDATRDAKHRITNSIVTLLVFFLFWSLISWLVPGGLLNS